jgi:hypothetical protein
LSKIRGNRSFIEKKIGRDVKFKILEGEYKGLVIKGLHYLIMLCSKKIRMPNMMSRHRKLGDLKRLV